MMRCLVEDRTRMTRIRLMSTVFFDAEERSILKDKKAFNSLFMKKYRLQLLIFSVGALFLASASAFYQFYKFKDGMNMTGGILFGIFAAFQAGELYAFVKNKKSVKLNKADKSTSE